MSTTQIDQAQTIELTGRHLIAGNWLQGPGNFLSNPAQGDAGEFSAGSIDLVDRAVKAAEKAFLEFGHSTRADRAEFLNSIADEIEKRAEQITLIGSRETGLPEARLQGERGRTVGQLRLFAEYILNPEYLDIRHDSALPDRQPLPRPDLRLMQRPIGPVAVFGASNFPLAFSVAGGDTASALAAGCPVVVKAHPAHPGTSEVIAQAIDAARQSCGMPPGLFSLLQGDGFEVGQALVKHPLIAAVGFTGSLKGGRALFDLCTQRPNPIPFFGELGSINPMFLLPHAVCSRGEEIGTGWAGSLTMGAGQFCTNPGVAVIVDGPEAIAFTHAAAHALSDVAPQTMLTDAIANAYREGVEHLASQSGVESVISSSCGERQASPNLFLVSGKTWLANQALAEEVFGPLGIIILVKDEQELLTIARLLEGQLTCSIHMETDDSNLAKTLVQILERKAGRLLVNGFPTGVEVANAMVHGGPYPASTNFGATSVGTMSIRRFLRPVCYQNLPIELLPGDLQEIV